jgi:hypothetical protein
VELAKAMCRGCRAKLACLVGALERGEPTGRGYTSTSTRLPGTGCHSRGWDCRIIGTFYEDGRDGKVVLEFGPGSQALEARA